LSLMMKMLSCLAQSPRNRSTTMTSSPSVGSLPAQVDPGLEISRDFAHYRLVPSVEQQLPGNSVRDRWEAGQVIF